MNIIIEFLIFKLVWLQNLTINKEFSILRPIFTKKSVSVLKQKGEHHHRILHIWISLHHISAQINNLELLN